MPWDGTELCVAEVADAGFGPHRVLAGGPGEAVCQVEWDAARALLALTDPDGWWNLYRVGLDGHRGQPGARASGSSAAPCGSSACAGSRRSAAAGTPCCAAGALAILDERSATVTDVETGPHRCGASSLVAADGMLVSSASRADRETRRRDAGPRPPAS